MAAVEVTISGVLYDKLSRSTRPVTIIGEAVVTGLEIGGGPIQPPSGGNGDHIWGPTDPRPGVGPIIPGGPGGRPPGGGGGGNGDHIWGPPDPRPGWGLPKPQPPLPPNMEEPQPGDPTVILPGNYPVQPIEPPPYLVVNYPGIGPVVVAPPADQDAGEQQPAPAPKK